MDHCWCHSVLQHTSWLGVTFPSWDTVVFLEMLLSVTCFVESAAARMFPKFSSIAVSGNDGFWASFSEAEMAELERNKPEVSEYNKKEEETEGFDLSLSLKNHLTNINELMSLLMVEKKGCAAAVDN